MDPAGTPAAAVQIRPLRTQEELHACVALQRETWGATFGECVPPAILAVTQRIGGVAAGAFDADGRLVGFVFGMTGVERGELVHWSDMLAVRPELRDQGIGRRLKAFQRETVARLGVRVISWSFDPLVARNAQLNLNRLGVRVVEYVRDMYGRETDSALHRGIGSDRFIVAWRIDGPEEAGPRPSPDAWRDARILNAPGDDDAPVMPALPGRAEEPVLRVEIPTAIDRVQATSLGLAGRWCATTRAAFEWAMARGYRVAGFHRDHGADRAFYLLSRAAPAPEGRA